MKPVRSVPPLPRRARDAHKGDFGRALIVGGSAGMPGAPVLAAAAALRSGAGLVELAVPRSVWAAAAARLPAALAVALEETPEGRACATGPAMERLLRRSDAAAIGPGMDTGDGPLATLTSFLRFANESDVRCVFDADALNLLASGALDMRTLPATSVLTPHPGEMARLTGRERDAVQADRRGVAAAYAKERGVIVVLKGAGTVVTDGERAFVNATGSHALARGGTGDVLSGAIAALLAQRMDPFDAAVLAVHAHGLAGDLARKRLGAMGMTAEDVVEALPAAWRKLGDR
jgi:NAD(P)H-hydrate epimerase